VTDTMNTDSEVRSASPIIPPSGNVEALQGMWDALINQIRALDEQLDSALGGKSAGRRAIINALVKDNSKDIAEFIGDIRTQIFDNVDFSDDQKVAFYFGLVSGLKDAFDEKANAILEPKVKEVPDTPPIPAEELESIVKTRNDSLSSAKNVRELLTMFGVDVTEYVVPRRRGGGGKRGVRAISKFTWSLDGERMPADKDSLTAISKELGMEKSKILRDLMREAGINLTEPVDPIEFTVPAEWCKDKQEHSIVGNKRADEEDDEEEDDENGDEEAE
jgi:hypothetical protein